MLIEECNMFGTDGIRGKVNKGYLTCSQLKRLGWAIAKAFESLESKRILIGKDTRNSGDMMEAALASSLMAQGWEVYLGGVLPTPAVSLLLKECRASLGIVLSASHNPPEDNGIKIFHHDGAKLDDEQEKRIEQAYQEYEETLIPWMNLGKRVYWEKEGEERYIARLISAYSTINLSGKTIALDCAHGATFRIAPKVFASLGAEVVPIGISPNGKNINLNSGALHPGRLQKLVLTMEADIGFCYDGDGDRVICINEKGEIWDGDYILAALARYYFQQGKLQPPKVAATSMSNLGLEEYLKNQGIELVRTKVGDRYVFEAMKKEDLILGGEQSGHIILQDFSQTGDGIHTSLALVALMMQEEKKLSELVDGFQKFPQLIHNIPVPCKPPFHEIPGLEQAIHEVEKELEGKGRLVFRYSGTEDLLRIMVEGKDERKIQEIKSRLEEVIKKGFQKYPS
ncbi:MAG: phosphoglucosamine mutase [Planctomycetota bacterium]|nr:MAG: phosphoglucosamine mutase [Planctomycetota bacterium]